MTGFDVIVLGIIAVAAVGGFLRGFVQEILSLAAWILAVCAIHYLHTPMSEWLGHYLGYTLSVSLLAFTMLLLIPYAAMKVIANNLGKASRNSLLGPIDRVLGFGFGALKGSLIAVVGFSLLVLGYDNVWSFSGRPSWITNARSYEFIDRSSRSLVQMIAKQRAQLRSDKGVPDDPDHS